MENQFVEYKQSWRDEFIKGLCAFANAQGDVASVRYVRILPLQVYINQNLVTFGTAL